MSFVTVYVPDCHESSTVSYGIIVTLCQKFVNPISACKRRKTAGFPTAFPSMQPYAAYDSLKTDNRFHPPPVC